MSNITPIASLHERTTSVSSISSVGSNGEPNSLLNASTPGSAQSSQSSNTQFGMTNSIASSGSFTNLNSLEKRKPIVVDSLVSFFAPDPLPPIPKLARSDFEHLFETRRSQLSHSSFGQSHPSSGAISLDSAIEEAQSNKHLDQGTKSNEIQEIQSPLDPASPNVTQAQQSTGSSKGKRDSKLDSSKQAELEIYASFSMYEEIVKLCQEQFIQERGNPAQLRLAHMLAKLASYDIGHAKRHLIHIQPSQRDPWMMTFMRQWVLEWSDIEKEKEKLRKSQSKQKSPTSKNELLHGPTIWEMLQEASKYVYTDNGNISLTSYISRKRKSSLFVHTRMHNDQENLSLWRQREISIMTMIINLYLLKDDYHTAYRLTTYLRDYSYIVYMKQQQLLDSSESKTSNSSFFQYTKELLGTLFSIQGRIAIYIGLTEDAEASFDTIKQFDKTSYWILLNNAMLLFARQDLITCRTLLQERRMEVSNNIQNLPSHSHEFKMLHSQLCEIVNNIAMTYFYSNCINEAVEELETHIRSDPIHHSDILTVSNLCKLYEFQSDAGQIQKKKTIRKLVQRYRPTDYPPSIYSLQ